MVHLFSSECIIKSGRADFLLLSLFSRIFQLFLHINTWLPCVASLILVYRELTVHSDVAPKTVPAAQPHWHHGDHTHLQFTPGVKPITMHPGGLLTGSTPLSQEEMESKWKERDVRRPGGVWTDAAQAGHFRVREDQWGHQGHHRNETKSTENVTVPDKPPFLTPSFPLPPLPGFSLLRQDRPWEFSPKGQESAV